MHIYVSGCEYRARTVMVNYGIDKIICQYSYLEEIEQKCIISVCILTVSFCQCSSYRL